MFLCLHLTRLGLANQEVLHFLRALKKTLPSEDVTNEQLAQACKDWLASGRVIPGYGHAVLRQTDPRFTCQKGFAEKHLQPISGLVKLVHQLYEVVPPVLDALGKVKNPYPNVDAHRYFFSFLFSVFFFVFYSHVMDTRHVSTTMFHTCMVNAAQGF